MNTIEFETEAGCYNPFPGFRTRGCSCCSRAIPVTRESINTAIQEAEAWLATLRALEPFDYSQCDRDDVATFFGESSPV